MLADPLRRCLWDASRPMSSATRRARAAAAAAEQQRTPVGAASAGTPPPPATEGRPWSQRRPRREGRRGIDQVVAYPLTLEQMYNGYVQQLPMERRIICPGCCGSGAKPGHKLKDCSLCGGEGVQGRQCEECGMRNWWGPEYVFEGPNRNALVIAGPHGEHIVVPLPNSNKEAPQMELQPCDWRCPQCRGSKLVSQKKLITIVVEKGVDRGDRIVFEEASNEHPGVIPGDLILQITGVCTVLGISQCKILVFFNIFLIQSCMHAAEIGPHPRFIRKQHNLVHQRSVSPKEAAAGFSFSLVHLDQRLISVTAAPGQIRAPVASLIIPGEGFPLNENALVKGDLIVICTILPSS